MVWINPAVSLLAVILSVLTPVWSQTTITTSTANTEQNVFSSSTTARRFLKCLTAGIEASVAFPTQERNDLDSIATAIISAVPANAATTSRATAQALTAGLATSLAEIVITESKQKNYYPQLNALKTILGNCFKQTTGRPNKRFIANLQAIVKALASTESDTEINEISNTYSDLPYQTRYGTKTTLPSQTDITFADSSASSLAASRAFSSAFSAATSSEQLRNLAYTMGLRTANILGIANPQSVANAVSRAVLGLGVGAGSYAYANAISNAAAQIFSSQGLLSQSNASALAASFASAFASAASSASATAASSAFSASESAAQAAAFSRAASKSGAQSASASQAASRGRAFSTTTTTSGSESQAGSDSEAQSASRSYSSAYSSAFAQSSASSLAASRAFSSAFSAATSSEQLRNIAYTLCLRTANVLGIANPQSVANAVSRAVLGLGVGAGSYAYANAISNAAAQIFSSQGLLSQSNASALAASFASAFATAASSAGTRQGQIVSGYVSRNSPYSNIQSGTGLFPSSSVPEVNTLSPGRVSNFVENISPLVRSSSGLSSVTSSSRVRNLTYNLSSAVSKGGRINTERFLDSLFSSASTIRDSNTNLNSSQVLVQSLLEGLSALIQVINSAQISSVSPSVSTSVQERVADYLDSLIY